MLTYPTAEPIYQFANNPYVIMGNTMASGADNVRAAMKWSFLHWVFFGLGMLCDRRALAAVFKLFTRVSVDTSVWSDPALWALS